MSQLNTNTILFDAECNFCQHCVKFFDSRSSVKFSIQSIQSMEARAILRKNGIQFVKLNTIYFVNSTSVFQKSSAIFQILKKLKYPYKSLFLFTILPRPFTDWAYDYIAKRRHLFLKTNSA